MTLFKLGNFISHSGEQLKFKIECDALTDDDIECLANFISLKCNFSKVIGIPHGGIRLQNALKKYLNSSSDAILIVDDVLTTGKSMMDVKSALRHKNIIGWVIFARNPTPHWINAVFTLYND